ncbi:MAG: peptidoglycan-binding domain-containing protein [Candidatus Nealsonbacteria bacterium]
MAKGLKIIFVGIIFLFLPVFVSAISLGEKTDFFVDPSYDFSQREEISAILQRIGKRAYFYIDNQWWEALEYQEKQQVYQVLQNLDYEFYYKIYPTLTSNFGSEWKPGIDKEAIITILIHPMKEEAGGYFNYGDEYPRVQNPKSNQREMFYLNADYITTSLAKSFLAHEFTHLITFNQKEKIYGVSEEIWLNEARAEYASTLVGYDSEYEGSNLQKRVKIFLENPSDSITEWQGKKADYGALNLFTQYLVEHYGVKILADSLKSKEIGIKSLNEALEKNGFEEDFSQIFTDWTITVLANNCSLGEKYCYKGENLKNLRVASSINFLPLKGNSSLGVSHTTKNWSGNWFKFIGGKGTLKIKFIGNPENLFRTPYLIRDFLGKYSLDFFQLDEYQRGEILIPRFGTEVSSVIIIPSIQSKISGFEDSELAFPFFWEASTITEIENENGNSNSECLQKPISEMTGEEILAKISEIENLLNQLKAQLVKIKEMEEKEPVSVTCQGFEQNLFYGLRNDDRVYCLQQFLKSQGLEIYPEGLVTGNFLSLTRTAVIRFQEKYADEILAPLGLERGTGFVGLMTRTKINQLSAQ